MRPEHDQETAQNRPKKQEKQQKELKYMKLNFNRQEYDLRTACTLPVGVICMCTVRQMSRFIA